MLLVKNFHLEFFIRFKLVRHIYDFDSKPDAEAFDFSQCFQAKERIEFGIRYRYPENFGIYCA